MAERKKSERKSVLLRLEPELFARVEAVRGDVSRQRFLERAVEVAVEPEGPYAFEAERQTVRAAVEAGATSVVVEGGSMAPAAVEGGEPGGPPPSGAERDAKPIVPPAKDGECPYSAAQLSGRSGLPVATCKRAIEDGTWRGLLP